jgi:hypothetical protein
MPAAHRREVLALIRREAEAPRPLAEFASDLVPDSAAAQLAADLLAAKEERSRAAWYVEAEPLWMRKLTWRLARPLFVVGVLGAIGFSLQRWVEPTLGVALFLAGAGGFYVAVQALAPLWARTDRRELERVDRRYRQRLEALLDAAGEPMPSDEDPR